MRNVFGLRLLYLAVLGATACGEPPQRIVSKDSPTPQPVPSAPKADPVRFGGTISLEGDLAGARTGAVFVSARRKGQRLPTLSRKYEITDPAWSAQNGKRVLAFELTDEHNMGGFGAPMGGEMEVEARYSPSGFIDPNPTNQEAGVVRASLPAAPGDCGVAIRLASGS